MENTAAAANHISPTPDQHSRSEAETSAPDNQPVAGQAGPLDKITLSGIAACGHHGVLAFERERGQRFEVDVCCWLDLTAAAARDNLAETLDYGQLARQVTADVEGQPLNLIEALALRIIHTCLASSGVQTVEVTVHKPEAPVKADLTDVAVTVTRSRTRE
jgi:dihydroneopterin aldolase